MIVAIVQFPVVPAHRDDDFRQWFSWSNDQLREATGLKARRLVRDQGGAYTALVEHDSAATFEAMHASPIAAGVQAGLAQILDESPQATLYEVVAQTAGDTCCAGNGARDAGTTQEARPVEAAATATSSGCCQSA